MIVFDHFAKQHVFASMTLAIITPKIRQHWQDIENYTCIY